MKIHTTQNLNSLGRMQSTNNVPIPSNELRLNYSERMRKQHLYDQQDTYEGNVSFKGKKEIIQKVIDNTKNTAGKEKKWYDKILTSGVFDKLLDSMNQEVFIQAAISFLICTFLRPLAIMAIPTKKSKEDNIYASAHSISSGIIGYVFAVVIYSPIKKGLDKIRKNPEKYAQKAEKFFTYNGTKKMAASKRFQTFTMLCNYVPQVITASIRSAITIAMIPYIDKYILNKIFGAKTQPTTKEELKEDPTYKFAFINFKNNNSSNANKVFQNFTGVMK